MASMRVFGWATGAALLGTGLTLAASAHARAEAPPPSSVCDAWFETGGVFSTSGHDLQFTLVNRSTAKSCVATRVMLLFDAPVIPEVVRSVAPAGWKASVVRCSGGHHVCGIAWEARRGVATGASLAGFGLVASPSVNLGVWVVELGGQRVALQYGAVGG